MPSLKRASRARQLGAEGYLYAPAIPLLGSGLRRPTHECETGFFFEHYGYVRVLEAVPPGTAEDAGQLEVPRDADSFG